MCRANERVADTHPAPDPLCWIAPVAPLAARTTVSRFLHHRRTAPSTCDVRAAFRILTVSTAPAGDGPEYTGRVTVTGPDVYELDADGDGIGCDS